MFRTLLFFNLNNWYSGLFYYSYKQHLHVQVHILSNYNCRDLDTLGSDGVHTAEET